jgi:hypothetical protein
MKSVGMADADGDGGVGSKAVGRVRQTLPRRGVVLAFVAFLFCFGQPVVVVALAVGSPSVASLAVIVVGTSLLAGPAARAYVRQGWSVSRLADYVLAVGFVQLGIVVAGRLAVAEAGGPAGLQPGLVVASYPVVYLLLTRVVWG